MGEVEARNQELLRLASIVENDSDYAIIIGDLNYRLSMPFETAVSLANEEKYDELMKFDQLTDSKSRDPELAKLREGPIYFPPTYKFDVGTDEYDTGPKHRAPAYTDRILVKTFPPRLVVGGPGVEPVFETDVVRRYCPNATFISPFFYRPNQGTPNFPEEPRCESYMCQRGKLSDHRPVRAVFEVSVPIEVRDKWEELELHKRKKRKEMQTFSFPVMEIAPEVAVYVGMEKKAELKNSGCCWARWTVSGFGEELKVTPDHGTLFPGISVEVAFLASKVMPAPIVVRFEAGNRCSAQTKVTTQPKGSSSFHAA
jgi:hypothetical protein